MSNPPPEPGCNYQYLHLEEHKDMLCELVSKHCDTNKLFNFYKLKYCHLSGSPYLTFSIVVVMMYIFFRYNQYIVKMYFTPALNRLRVKTKMSKDLFGLVVEPLIYGLGGLIITITSCLDNIDAALPVGGMFGYNILELGLLMGINTFLIKLKTCCPTKLPNIRTGVKHPRCKITRLVKRVAVIANIVVPTSQIVIKVRFKLCAICQQQSHAITLLRHQFQTAVIRLITGNKTVPNAR